jgi:hypothetical protein
MEWLVQPTVDVLYQPANLCRRQISFGARLAEGHGRVIAKKVHRKLVADVRLHDVLKSHDPVVATAAAAITREAQEQGLGNAVGTTNFRSKRRG